MSSSEESLDSELPKIRENTLEILSSLDLSGQGDSSLSGISLSKQAGSQKQDLAELYGEDLLRDMRLLASEARNDLECLRPGGNDPHAQNINVEFKDNDNKLENMFGKITENVYEDLVDLTERFKACYEVSEFKEDVERLEANSDFQNRHQVLTTCYKLLELAEEYINGVIQSDKKLTKANRNLLEFLEEEAQDGNIERFYKENKNGEITELTPEDLKKQLQELTKFLEVEKDVHHRLKSIKNRIKNLEDVIVRLDPKVKESRQKSKAKLRT